MCRYLDDDEGIKKFFAAFHLYDKFPVSVVIDDFGDFFDERYFLFFMDRLCGFVFVFDLILFVISIQGAANKDMVTHEEETWQWFGH